MKTCDTCDIGPEPRQGCPACWSCGEDYKNWVSPSDGDEMAMSDVSELAALLRQYASHRTFTAPKAWEEAVTEAADALETLAGEVERLRTSRADEHGYLQDNVLRAVARAEFAESRLAKLAPVVEAARAVVADHAAYATHGSLEMDALIRALATLEAAHD